MRSIIFSYLTAVGFLGAGKALGAQLLVVESEHSKCSAYSVDFPQKSRKSLWVMAECPDNIIIHEKFVYYSVGKKIFKRSMNWNKSVEQLVAEFPADSGYTNDIWIDKKTKILKIRYEVLVDEANFSQSKSDPSDVVFKYKGKSYTTSKQDGAPAMAVASELRGTRWKTLKELPTFTDASYSMGVRVLDPDFGPERGAGKNFSWRYSPNLDALANLDMSQTLRDNLSKNNSGTPFAKKLNSKKQLIYYFGELPDGREAGFSAPIYFCDVPCKKPRPIDVKSKLIFSIEASANALAIRTSEKDLKVFSIDSEKMILDKSNIHMTGWLD